jgi:hypothetical protein
MLDIKSLVAGATPSTFFALFGGPNKFDEWLNYTADWLAKPESTTIGFLPPGLQTLMGQPHEVVDLILDNLHSAGLFTYHIVLKSYQSGFKVKVIDHTTNTIIEEKILNLEKNEKQIEEYYCEKYGPAITWTYLGRSE